MPELELLLQCVWMEMKTSPEGMKGCSVVKPLCWFFYCLEEMLYYVINLSAGV